MHLAMRINIMTLKSIPHGIFIALLLLILVLIPGIGIVRAVPEAGSVSATCIQPAEVMKLTVMLLLANFKRTCLGAIQIFPFLVLLIIGIIFALIILQPDFGTGLVIVASSICFCF